MMRARLGGDQGQAKKKRSECVESYSVIAFENEGAQMSNELETSSWSDGFMIMMASATVANLRLLRLDIGRPVPQWRT